MQTMTPPPVVPVVPDADPFGRLMPDDGSQERLRGLPDLFRIAAPVGPADPNEPEDVARVENMMDQLGELDLKQTDGPTGYYGERLKQAIAAFQKKSGLPGTGRMAPGDATMAAVRKALVRPVAETEYSPWYAG